MCDLITDMRRIAYNDNNLHPLGHSAAPTRGSSPVPSLKHPSTKAEEDAEMERALANSRQDLPYGSQETGIIGADGKTQNPLFGPATRSTYDPSQWAMTISGPADTHETSEVIPDVEPKERGANGDNPRFLKQLPSGDYLPNLLTIAHSIPLAREALITRSHVSGAYGHDSDWWRGHAIRLPRIVHAADGSAAAPVATEHEEIVAEMQRLMALLEMSNRLYGSTESLVRLAKGSRGYASETLLDQVIRTWETAANTVSPNPGLQNGIFHSVIGTSGAEGVLTPNMWLLPLNVTHEDESSGMPVTLAEIMDRTLWDTDPNDDAFCDTYMEHCADVLPMRLVHTDPTKTKLDVVIPAEFYVDKYLRENVESTRVIRKRMAQTKKRMAKVDEILSKIKSFKHPSKSGSIDASDFVGYTVKHFNGENRKVVLESREARGIDLSADLAPLPDNYASISARLEAACHSISEKLDGKSCR